MQRKKITAILTVFSFIAVSVIFFASSNYFASDPIQGTLQAVNIVPNSSSIAQYDKFELSFDINRTTTGKNLNEEIDAGTINPYWPYDPNPAANIVDHPNAVLAGVGISVDGLFSNDDWQSSITQPAFYFLDYSRSGDWLYPQGIPKWKIRFAPTATGNWQYRIQITDQSGVTTSSSSTFAVTTTASPGFVRASSEDSRYFETDDGKYLNLIGSDTKSETPSVIDANFQTFHDNGINLVRPWWQGSQGPVLFGLSGQGGIPNWGVEPTAEATRPGELFSGKLSSANKDPNFSVDVKPNTKYRYSAWVKTVGVNGPVDPDLNRCEGKYGVWLQAFRLGNGQSDICLTSATPTQGSKDWQQISAVITSSGESSIEYLKVILSSLSGTAYFTDLSLQEEFTDGQGIKTYGPNILKYPSLNAYKQYSQRSSWIADYEVEKARELGIYLKVVLEEKDDIIFGSIKADGTVDIKLDKRDWDNVFASPTSANRTYQQYYWRYIIARYGYATSIHSFELLNEGDPFSGNHANAVQSLAAYLKNNDPNKHLVSTSNYHSYPTKEMWSQEQSPDVGYTDWHAYIGPQHNSEGNLHLQYVYGFHEDNFNLDNTVKHSGNNSLRLVGNGDNLLNMSYPMSILSGHRYTLSWWIKGQGVTAQNSAGDPSWIHPTIVMGTKDGWWGNELSDRYYPGNQGDFMGTYDWRQVSYSFDSEIGARYLYIAPSAQYAFENIWFDDITLHDDTTGKDVEVPNGNFESPRLDYDSALLTYSMGTQAGLRESSDTDSRVARKPIIYGEAGISADRMYPDPYKGLNFTGENQQLVDDINGVWLRKFQWGQLNPYGVIGVYWWDENIKAKNLYHYFKAYRDFMTNIPLSNGNYKDANAVLSNSNMRAWGQKDLVNNQAHLWIDNTTSNWKNVVDGVSIPSVSGAVTLNGLANGNYSLQWWDTSSGQIITPAGYPVSATSSNSAISITIPQLESDIALKIFPEVQLLSVGLTGPSSVRIGDYLAYEVDVTNPNTVAISQITATLPIPPNTQVVSNGGGQLFPQTNPNVIRWTNLTVNAGQTLKFTPLFRIKSP